MKRTNSGDRSVLSKLLSCLDDHPSWVLDCCKESIEQASDVIGRDGETELRFTHRETTGVLLFTIPRNPGAVNRIRGILQQTLDRRQQPNPSTDPFLDQLVSAQTAIAEAYERDEIFVVSDPVSILEVEILSSCDCQTINHVLSDVASASREIQILHEEILSILQQYSKQ